VSGCDNGGGQNMSIDNRQTKLVFVDQTLLHLLGTQLIFLFQ
jgi:hypothetical protein